MTPNTIELNSTHHVCLPRVGVFSRALNIHY
jgi:hypothetical protein